MGGCCSSLSTLTMQEWMVWNTHPIRQFYEVIADLGEGAFSLVVLAKHKNIPKKFVALKVVYLRSPDMLQEPEHLAIMKREAYFLKKLQHPNIVRCEDVVDDGNQMVLVMEYLAGGQLFDQLEQLAGEHYSEKTAAQLFKQMAAGLKCMHEAGIVNRDVKGENFIFAVVPSKAACLGKPLVVKFIDLGMATEYDPKDSIRGALGSPGFVAPEIVKNAPHTPAMDVFSLGVVLFIMLVGRKPFSVRQCEDLSYAHLQLADAPGFNDPRYDQLSDEAKEVLDGMLCFDPDKRLRMHEVLALPWVMTEGGAVARPLGVEVTKGAANTAALRRFRNLQHGIVSKQALRPLPASKVNLLDNSGLPDLEDDSQKDWSVRLGRQRQAANKTRGYRGDSSGRQISSADSASIALNARSYARMHDSGQTVDTPDSSRHIRPHSDRSAHGGGAFYSMHGNGAAFDALNEEREAEAEATARNSMQASRPSMQGERGLQPNASMRKSCSETNLQRENSASGGLWRSLGLSMHTMARAPSSKYEGSWHGSRHGSQDGSVRGGTINATENGHAPVTPRKESSRNSRDSKRPGSQRRVNVISPY